MIAPRTRARIANVVTVIRVTVSEEVLKAKAGFGEQSSNKQSVGQLKWAIFKLSDNYREVVLEQTSSDTGFESFRQALVDSQSVSYEPYLHLTLSRYAYKTRPLASQLLDTHFIPLALRN
jgi:hypothetical protein